MKKIKFILTILLATIVAGSAFAQNRTVSGTVKDSNGEPVVGAAVIVPKSTIGASTDIDGKFALENNSCVSKEHKSFSFGYVQCHLTER